MMADVPASPAVRRGWRGWTWGWIALGAAIATWCGVFLLVVPCPPGCCTECVASNTTG